jgi:glycosyl transferase family 87
MKSTLAKAIIVLSVTGALIGFLATHSSLIQRNVALRDSLSYWAAARLLVQHQNPYSHDAVLALERQSGYSADRPLVLRTPPWSLFMVLPLGLVNPLAAWVCWLGLLFLCLTVGVRVCARLYHQPNVSRMAFTVAAYLFAPVAACLVSGQMGLLLMIGVILFLRWVDHRPFLAGLVLIFPFAKPHLLAQFWLVLLIWVAVRRKRQVALGFGTALMMATLLALFFDPHVFRHYREMLQQAAIGNEFIPALSGVLRLLFFRRHFWVQFLPMAIGIGWSLWYLHKNWPAWDWKVHGPALLVVAVLTTPYEWLSDETVLLPAILQALVFILGIGAALRLWSKLILVGIGLLDGLLLLILRFQIPFSTGIYFWSSLVWFGWYFYAQRLARQAISSTKPATQAIPASL